MNERVLTILALLKKGTEPKHRPYFILLVILVMVGAILALARSRCRRDLSFRA